jgi:CBS domain-containing protein
MAREIGEIMSTRVEAVEPGTTVHTAALIMKENDIGDVLVTETGGKLHGILTDRDIVVRAVALGLDCDMLTVGEICTRENLHCLASHASIDDAAELMRTHALRRIPVVDDGSVVGVLSLGDLAQAGDSEPALADISAAPPNN